MAIESVDVNPAARLVSPDPEPEDFDNEASLRPKTCLLYTSGVHDAVGDLLIVAESAGLLEHLVHKRRFAVVDVGDDGNVAQIGLFHDLFFPLLSYVEKLVHFLNQSIL